MYGWEMSRVAEHPARDVGQVRFQNDDSSVVAFMTTQIPCTSK